MQQKKFFIKRLKQYLLSFMMPVFIVLLAGTVMLGVQTVHTLDREGRDVLSSINTNLELSLSNIIAQNEQFSNNPYTMLSLKRLLDRNEYLSYSDALNMRGINAALRSTVDTYDYVAGVYVYLEGYDNYYTSDKGVKSIYDQECIWYDSYEKMTKDANTFMETITEDAYGNNRQYLIVYQRMLLRDGVVVMKIDLEAYQNMLKRAINSEDCSVALINMDGRMVASWNDENQVGLELTDSKFSRIGIKGSWERLKEGSYLLHKMDNDVYNLHIYSIISAKQVMEEFMRIGPWMILLIVVAGFSLFIAAYFTTHQNFDYFEHIIQVFGDAEKGIYPSIEDSKTANDEYGVILNNIIYLYLQTVKLNDELKEKKYEQEIVEVGALQAQINPHFMFNTLQMIAFKAAEKTHQDTEVVKMTTDLSDILKYALADPLQPITLKEEVNYLKKYVSIQQSRFGDQFIIYYEIEEELKDFPVFRLMLQPLIENSILHGVRYKKERGHIKLVVFPQKEKIVFRVIDNGIGMDKEELTQLMDSIQQYNVHNVGLANVNCRLRLYFGEEATLRIRTRKDWGTIVEFKIPKDGITKFATKS